MSDVQKWHWIEWSDEYPPLKHFWHWYFRRSCRFSISVPRKISIICRCSMQLGDASFILISNTPFYSSKNDHDENYIALRTPSWHGKHGEFGAKEWRFYSSRILTYYEISYYTESFLFFGTFFESLSPYCTSHSGNILFLRLIWSTTGSIFALYSLFLVSFIL